MRLAVPLSLLAVLAPLAIRAQAPSTSPLPIGTRVQGTAGGAAVARYAFSPPSAGLLTVAVHSQADVGIQVTDVDGQLLPGGNGDLDFGGNPGLEFLSIPLTTVDAITVLVTSVSGDQGGFTITAGFVAEPAFAVPADPDRRPSLATPLTVGQSHVDALNPTAGDQWDWYTITAADDGTLTFVTRTDGDSEPGDIALELYLGGEFSEPVAQSDDDLQGVATNESVTAMVKKGDRVHLKVISLFDTADPFGYRVSVGRMP